MSRAMPVVVWLLTFFSGRVLTATTAPTTSPTIMTIEPCSSYEMKLQASITANEQTHPGSKFHAEWRLNEASRANLGDETFNAMSAFLAAVPDDQFDLEIPYDQMPSGYYQYEVLVSADPNPGNVNPSTQEQPVVKAAFSPPIVSYSPSQDQDVWASDFTALKLTLTPVPFTEECDSLVSRNLVWSQTKGPSVDLPRDNDLYMVFNSGVLLPATDYEFEITITSTLPNLPAFNDIKIPTSVEKIKIRVRASLTPTLQSTAKLDLATYQLLVSFDHSTDQANMWDRSPCSDVLTPAILAKFPNPACQWLSGTVLAVTWEGNPTVVEDDIVNILPNKLMSRDGTSEYASALVDSSVKFANIPVIAVHISGPSTVSSECGTLVLDASLSFGTAGGTYSAVWSVEGTSADVSEINTKLASLTDSRITIPLEWLSVADYEFKVNLTNWLGDTGAGSKTVTVSKDPVPALAFGGSTNGDFDLLRVSYDEFSRSGDVSIVVEGVGASVPCAAKYEGINVTWSQTTEFALNSWVLGQNRFIIPKAYLRFNQTYEFMFKLKSNVSDSLSVQRKFILDLLPLPDLESVVDSARFVTGWSAIQVSFKLGMGLVGAQEGDELACTQVLLPESLAFLGEQPECKWAGPSVLEVSPGLKHDAQPGKLLKFVNASLLKLADGFVWTKAISIAIQAPLLHTPPEADVTGRAAVGYCEPISLDASLSSGGAGQPLKYKWTIQRDFLTHDSPDTDVEWRDAYYTMLDGILLNYNTSELLLPSYEGDYWYNRTFAFKVTIENWLGESAFAVSRVYRSAFAIPDVGIKGSQSLVMRADDKFFLGSRVQLSPCELAGQELEFSWEINDDDVKLPADQLTKEFFYLKPFSLPPKKEYTFTLAVEAKGGVQWYGEKASASMTVYVEKARLRARIKGNDGLISNHTNLTLDASQSMDPHDKYTIMSYEWSCELKPSGVRCFEAFVFPTTKVVVIPKELLLPTKPGTSYSFSVQVSADKRRSVDSIRYEVTAGEVVPMVVEPVVAGGVRFNPISGRLMVATNALFMIEGILDVPNLQPTASPTPSPTMSPTTKAEAANASSSVEELEEKEWIYSWSCDTLNMTNRSQFATDLNTRNFAIKQNVLQADIEYTFRVAVYADDKRTVPSGVAFVTVFVIRPPSKGSCKVGYGPGTSDNPYNMALKTKFAFSCQDWSADASDFPLQYCFSLEKGPYNDAANLGYCQRGNMLLAPLPKPYNHEVDIIPAPMTVRAIIRTQRGAEAEAFIEVPVAAWQGLPTEITERRNAGFMIVDEAIARGNMDVLASNILQLTSMDAGADNLGLLKKLESYEGIGDTGSIATELQMVDTLVKRNNPASTRKRAMDVVAKRLNHVGKRDNDAELDPKMAESVLAVFDSGLGSALADNSTQNQDELIEMSKSTSQAIKQIGKFLSQKSVANMDGTGAKSGKLSVQSRKRDKKDKKAFQEKAEGAEMGFPPGMLDSDEDLTLVTAVNQENLIKNEDGTDDSVSSVVTIQFVKDDEGEAKVKGLKEPIQITIMHKEPMELQPKGKNKGETSSVCRFTSATDKKWGRDGCKKNRELSDEYKTVCECTHLTEFNIMDDASERWDELSTISELRVQDFDPQFKGVNEDDFNNVTWENLMTDPGPLFLICFYLIVYALVVPCLHTRDKVKHKHFLADYVFDYDDTFTLLETGSVVTSLKECKEKPEVTLDLHHHHICVNPLGEFSRGTVARTLDLCQLLLPFLRCECRKKERPQVTIKCEGPNAKTAGRIIFQVTCKNLPRTDLCSAPDPVVGILFKNTDDHWVPYARTELAINVEAEHTFSRRIIVPAERLDEEMAIVVFDHDCHYGLIEAVDENNELFHQNELLKRKKFSTFKSKFTHSMASRHSWFSIYFDSDGCRYFPSIDRLNILFVGTFAISALTATMYTTEESPAEFWRDIITALYAGLLFVPIGIVLYYLTTHSGHKDPWMKEMSWDYWEYKIEEAIEISHELLPAWMLKMGKMGKQEQGIHEKIDSERQKGGAKPSKTPRAAKGGNNEKATEDTDTLLLKPENKTEPPQGELSTEGRGLNDPMNQAGYKGHLKDVDDSDSDHDHEIMAINIDDDPKPPPPPPAAPGPAWGGDKSSQKVHPLDLKMRKTVAETNASTRGLLAKGLKVNVNANGTDARMKQMRKTIMKSGGSKRTLEHIDLDGDESCPPCGVIPAFQFGDHFLLMPSMELPYKLKDISHFKINEMKKAEKRLMSRTMTKNSKERAKKKLEQIQKGTKERKELSCCQKCQKKRLPKCVRPVTRVVCLALMGVFAYFTLVYGVKFALEMEVIETELENAAELERIAEENERVAQEMAQLKADYAAGKLANMSSAMDKFNASGALNFNNNTNKTASTNPYAKKLDNATKEEMGSSLDDGASYRWLATNAMALGQEAFVTEPLILFLSDVFVVYCGGALIIEALQECGILAP